MVFLLMHKSPHIEKIVSDRLRKDKYISYEVASLYCDFVENYIRAGGKFTNGEGDAYFGIYNILLASDLTKDSEILSHSIILGDDLEKYKACKTYQVKLCSLSTPLEFDPPQINLDILREMRHRGIKAPLHDIVPIDNIDKFGEFIAQLLFCRTDENRPEFAQKIIDEILNDLDYETIKNALATNKDTFLYNHQLAARKIISGLKEAIEPVAYAERTIKAWKPIRI